MASNRKPSQRDLDNFAKRCHAIDAIRCAEQGIDYAARREQWSNERKAAVRERLIHMVRTTFKPNSKGERLVLDEGAGKIDGIANAVYSMDADAAAKKAQAFAKPPAAPTSTEVAEHAQGEELSQDPAVIAAAEALYAEHVAPLQQAN